MERMRMVFRVMLVTVLSLLLGAFLVGCGSAIAPTSPSLTSTKHPVTSAPARLILDLAVTSGLQTQTVAHRWQVSDIYQYVVTLKVWNGSAFVDESPALKVTLPQKGTIRSQAVFANLKQGCRYQASVEAQGCPGGSAPTTVMNAQSPCVSEFDFTGTQDIVESLTRTMMVVLDARTFSGQVHVLPQGSIPKSVATYTAYLYDQDRGAFIWSLSYPKSQALTLSNLKLGTHYVVWLVGADSTGGRVSALSWAPVYFDSTGQDIEQEINVPVTF